MLFPQIQPFQASPPAPKPSGKERRHERQASWALFISTCYLETYFEIKANLSQVYWNLSDLLIGFIKWVEGKISQGLISELELRLCSGVLSTQRNASPFKYFDRVEIRHLCLYIFFRSWRLTQGMSVSPTGKSAPWGLRLCFVVHGTQNRTRLVAGSWTGCK